MEPRHDLPYRKHRWQIPAPEVNIVDRLTVGRIMFVVALACSLTLVYQAPRALIQAQTPVSDGFDFPVGDPNGNGSYRRWDNGQLCTGGWHVSYDVTDPRYPEHTGEDWNGACGGNSDLGQPVYAASAGQVTYAQDTGGGFGRVVVIRHQLPSGEVVWTQYAHLDTILVRRDAVVRRREPIGTIGRSGLRSGEYAHLHFEVRRQDLSPTYWPRNVVEIRTRYYDPSDRARDPSRSECANGICGWGAPGFIDAHRVLGTPPYRAQWIDKNAHPVLRRGDCYGFFTRFRNVGTATWVRNIVRLGTDQPRDRIPSFIREDRCTYQSSGWLSGNRVALRESSVAPNGIGSFLFWYTVPSTMAWGVYPEYFRLVADGVTWMTEVDPWTFWNVNVIDCPSCQSRDHYHVWATGSGATNKAVFWAANSFVAKSPSIRRVTFNAAWSARAIVAIFNCPAMTWDSCLVAYQTVPVVQYGASAADWPTPVPVTVGRRYWVQIGATPQVPGNPLLAYFSATNSYRAADAPGQPAVDASCAVYHHISNATRTTDCGIDLNVRVESP